MLMGILIGIESPLIAIQLLWINLVTDSLPAIALGLEPEDKNIMSKKPINSKKGIFADGLWSKIMVEGAMIGIITLLAFTIGNNMFGLEVGRTMAFATMSMLELIHAFNVRTDESIFSIGFFTNKYMCLAVAVGSVLQIGVITIEPIAKIFKVIPLTPLAWIIVMLLSISPLIIVEIQKQLNRFIFVERVYPQRKNAIRT